MMKNEIIFDCLMALAIAIAIALIVIFYGESQQFIYINF